MDGYAAILPKRYHESKNEAGVSQYTSAVLSKRRVGCSWVGKQFQGIVAEYRVTRNRIIDENGNLREEFRGMKGYAVFAERYHESRMQRAFQNVSAVLGGKKEMKRLGLGWKLLRGSSSQYYELINFFRTIDRELLQGLEGQKLTAETIFGGHTINTYANVSILREVLLGGRKEFTRLGWVSKKF